MVTQVRKEKEPQRFKNDHDTKYSLPFQSAPNKQIIWFYPTTDDNRTGSPKKDKGQQKKRRGKTANKRLAHTTHSQPPPPPTCRMEPLVACPARLTEAQWPQNGSRSAE